MWIKHPDTDETKLIADGTLPHWRGLGWTEWTPDVSGESFTPPSYAYTFDAETGAWTATPGATPGAAVFAGPEGRFATAAGDFQNVPWERTLVENDAVATIDGDDPTLIVVAEPGVYLTSWWGFATPGTPATTESFLGGDVTGTLGMTHSCLLDISTSHGWGLSGSGLLLIDPSQPATLTVGGNDVAWQWDVVIIVARLN